MEVLQDGVLAFLAATGLAALFWLLTGWFRRREPARVMLMIPERGDAMRITLHIGPYTVTIIVKKRENRHSAK